MENKKFNVIVVGDPNVDKLINASLLDVAKQLIERSIHEINHLKHEYKDVGHGGKYIHDAEKFLENLADIKNKLYLCTKIIKK